MRCTAHVFGEYDDISRRHGFDPTNVSMRRACDDALLAELVPLELSLVWIDDETCRIQEMEDTAGRRRSMLLSHPPISMDFRRTRGLFSDETLRAQYAIGRICQATNSMLCPYLTGEECNDERFIQGCIDADTSQACIVADPSAGSVPIGGSAFVFATVVSSDAYDEIGLVALELPNRGGTVHVRGLLSPSLLQSVSIRCSARAFLMVFALACASRAPPDSQVKSASFRLQERLAVEG